MCERLPNKEEYLFWRSSESLLEDASTTGTVYLSFLNNHRRPQWGLPFNSKVKIFIWRGYISAVARLCENERSFHVSRCCLCEAMGRTAGPAASSRQETIAQQSRSHVSHPGSGCSSTWLRETEDTHRHRNGFARTVKWFFGWIRLRFWISPINHIPKVCRVNPSLIFVMVENGKMIDDDHVSSVSTHQPSCVPPVSNHAALQLLLYFNLLPLASRSALSSEDVHSVAGVFFGLSGFWGRSLWPGDWDSFACLIYRTNVPMELWFLVELPSGSWQDEWASLNSAGTWSPEAHWGGNSKPQISVL